MFRIHGSGRSALTVITATAAASVALLISATVVSAGPDDPVTEWAASAIPPPNLAKFGGLYDVHPDHINTAKTCVNRAGGSCVLYFATPRPAVECRDTGELATWARFSPQADTAAPATRIDLYWVGGGVLAGQAPAADGPGVYATRIKIGDVCGDDTMASGVPDADALLGTARPGAFTGYVDSLAA